MYYDNGMSYEDYECGNTVIQLCRTKEKALEYIRNMSISGGYTEGYRGEDNYWKEVAEDENTIRIFYEEWGPHTSYEWYMIQEYEVI